MKKSLYDLKLRGPLTNFKTRSGSLSGLRLLIYDKNRIEISVDCPFKANFAMQEVHLEPIQQPKQPLPQEDHEEDQTEEGEPGEGRVDHFRAKY